MEEILERVANLCDEYRKKGYHCSESSIRAVSEVLGIPLSEELLRISSGFRGGGGGFRERCGITEVGIILISLKYGRKDLQDDDEKYNYLVKVLHERFLEELGSYTCRILKPFYSRLVPDKSCSHVYREGAKIVAKLLLEADALLEEYERQN